MAQSFFIGVDGGATKCIVRVEDESGRILGREISGPANIRLSVTQAWASIHSALNKILNPLDIRLGSPGYVSHAGMGLAGCEIVSAYESFLAQPHFFETLAMSSDAHTACLGAHAGKNGSIIIVGTGVVGFQIDADQTTTKVSGWGFPHDDEGGGASLGLQAVKITLQALDGRRPFSSLAKLVYERFEDNLDYLVTWANEANSTSYAELAPLVIQQSEAGDPAAIELMQEAALAVNRVSEALQSAQSDPGQVLPCSLVGGISPFIQPYLNEKLRTLLSPCHSTPDVGAVLLVRDYLRKDVK